MPYKDPKHRKKNFKKWYKKNKERLAEKRRKQYEDPETREKILNYYREYRKNPENKKKRKEYWHRYYLRKKEKMLV